MRIGWRTPLQFSSADNVARGVLARLQFSWSSIAAIVLGALLAKWAWALFAPPDVAMVYAAERGSSVAAENLFGIAATPAGNAQLAAVQNIRLVGVFAGTPGFAIFELHGKQLAVPLGAEVAQGATLAEIAADHVIIKGVGLSQRVDLARRGAAHGANTGEPAAGIAPVPEQRMAQDRQLPVGVPP